MRPVSSPASRPSSRLRRRAALGAGFVLGAGLVLAGGARHLFADEPPVAPAPAPAPSPAPATDAARIRRLVEDLGAADFRVREAAWKELVVVGDAARPALEDAVKREDPAVRFRAEQLLARLDGGSREKPLDDGATPNGGAAAPKDGSWGPNANGPGGAGAGGGAWGPQRGSTGGTWGPTPGGTTGGSRAPAGPGRFFTDEDFERLMGETQQRMRQLEEEMRRAFGNGNGMGLGGFAPFLGRPDRTVDVEVDGGALHETRRGARLELKTAGDPAGASKTTVYEGRSFDAILELNPELKALPAVTAIGAKRAALLAARAAERAGPFGGVARSMNRSVSVETVDGKTRLTVTETGPDGKPTTTTYEGVDLEQIRREHPEVAGALGGMRITFGRPGGSFRAGRDSEDDDRDDADEDDAPDDDAPAATGPFGLALAPVDAVLASHLGLANGHGAVVAVVRPDSDAARLGLRANDVLVAVNGTTIVSGVGSVAELLRAAKAGPLRIDVVRAGKILTLSR